MTTDARSAFLAARVERHKPEMAAAWAEAIRIALTALEEKKS